jgi:5'-deoxynucleotidase YfbR-like HD superfamily hydrolase
MFAPEERRFQAALQGLFHDGSDYIMGDVTKWLKRTDTMRGFREYEDAAQRAVYERFGCETEMFPEVKAADDLMVRVEAEDTWGPRWSAVDGYGPLNETEKALVEEWNPFSWGASKEAFLAAYRELTVSV